MAGRHGHLHRNRIPDHAERRVRHAAFEQGAQGEGGIAGRAAAGVIGLVRDDHCSRFNGQRLVQRFIEGQRRQIYRVTDGEELFAEFTRQLRRQSRIVIGDRQHIRTASWHVSPGETMRQREREQAGVVLTGDHLVNEAAHGLEGRQVEADHAAVVERHGWFGLSFGGIGDDGEEFFGAVVDIDVRVFLEDDDGVDGVDGFLCDVAVQV